jgi:hypothetical protein
LIVVGSIGVLKIAEIVALMLTPVLADEGLVEVTVGALGFTVVPPHADNTNATTTMLK